MTLQTSIIPKNKTDRHLTNRDILADHRLTDRDILANHHLTDKDILADHSLTNKDILTSHHLANRDTQIPQKELVNIGDVQPSVKITTIAVMITTTRTVATLETDTKISQMRDTDINQNLQIIIGLNHLGDLHQNLLTGLDLLIITHTVIGQIHLIVHKISTNVDAGRAIVLVISAWIAISTNHRTWLKHVMTHAECYLNLEQQSNIASTIVNWYRTHQSVVRINKVLMTVL